MVELGISTFGETTALEATGQIYSHDERIRRSRRYGSANRASHRPPAPA